MRFKSCLRSDEQALFGGGPREAERAVEFDANGVVHMSGRVELLHVPALALVISFAAASGPTRGG